MPYDGNPTSFVIYRWINPETTSDYPFLAVADRRSVLLSLGNYGMTLDWGIPEEAAVWLARDFELTGESLVCDLSMVERQLSATFAGGAEFASLTFTTDLTPSALRLALVSQEEADQGPEYVIHSTSNYERLYREPEGFGPVGPSESAMLDSCIATFTKLAAQCAAKLTAPPPPRYRTASTMEPLHSH